uniref:Uncharacterized protein n=1 Tax=Lactuca sativa TaxID=4236 RepID=A0A9R1UGR3_LACSA|nr:hypothetical protein LSAT_V11C900479250 [Lactuca sativa]
MDGSKDCKFYVWVDEDLGMHWHKSKLNELHRENVELFKEYMNLSKMNMDLEKENLVLQKNLMKLKVNDKQEPDIFLCRLMMFGIVVVGIFSWFLFM